MLNLFGPKLVKIVIQYITIRIDNVLLFPRQWNIDVFIINYGYDFVD